MELSKENQNQLEFDKDMLDSLGLPPRVKEALVNSSFQASVNKHAYSKFLRVKFWTNSDLDFDNRFVLKISIDLKNRQIQVHNLFVPDDDKLLRSQISSWFNNYVQSYGYNVNW